MKATAIGAAILTAMVAWLLLWLGVGAYVAHATDSEDWGAGVAILGCTSPLIILVCHLIGENILDTQDDTYDD